MKIHCYGILEVIKLVPDVITALPPAYVDTPRARINQGQLKENNGGSQS
jgi:hypothetical protein